MNRVLSAALTSLVATGTLFATALPAHADITSLTVAGQAMLSNEDRTATITGTIACTDGEMYNVTAVVTQASGVLSSAIGTGNLVPLGDFLPCTGSALAFQIPVTVEIPPNGHYVVGPAEVSVAAVSTGDPAGTDTQRVDRTVELFR